MQELKPCPFCPDGGELEVHATRICEGWYTASVLCNQCGVQMIRGGDTEQEAKDYVTQAWNIRAEGTNDVEQQRTQRGSIKTKSSCKP